MHPFDDFRALLNILPEKDEFSQILVLKKFQDNLEEEASLGKLEKLLAFYASWRGAKNLELQKPLLAFFVGNHSLVKEDKQKDYSWTKRMVDFFSQNQTPTNIFCQIEKIQLKIFDLALDYPIMNIKYDESLDARSAAATMAYGMESIVNGVEFLALSSFGKVNNIANAAIATALFGGNIEDWLIQGKVKDKTDLDLQDISLILEKHKQNFNDSFEIMRCLGGRETAAIIGAILAARMEKIPVILDDYTALVAGAILHKQNPRALDHCLVSFQSKNVPYQRLIKKLGKEAFFDYDINSNQGMNSALIISMLKNALLIYNNLQKQPSFYFKK